MKTAAQLFLQIDPIHNRLDFRRLAAYFVSLLIVIGWSVVGVHNIRDLLLRLATSSLFMVIARMLLSRLGASRISAIIAVGITLGLALDLSAADLMLANLFGATMLLIQEYFMVMSKAAAVSTALAVGVLASGAGNHFAELIFLVVSVLLCRISWHAMTSEKLSKRILMMFATKAIAVVAVIFGIDYLADRLTTFSYNLPPSIPVVELPGVILILVALVVLRGLWVTLLLETSRSPKNRMLRIFYTVYVLVLLALAAAISQYGDRVFLSGVVDAINSWGLGSFGAVQAYSLFVLGLMFTAGIDRSLLTSSAVPQKVAKTL